MTWCPDKGAVNKGYAYLVRREDNGAQAIFVCQVDADGLVRSTPVYNARPPTG